MATATLERFDYRAVELQTPCPICGSDLICVTMRNGTELVIHDDGSVPTA